MEQLSSFEVVKFVFVALLSLSALRCFWGELENLFWIRFFRSIFVLSVFFLIIFPLNVFIDAGEMSFGGRYVINFFATAVMTVICMIAIIVLSILTTLLQKLWDWITVSN